MKKINGIKNEKNSLDGFGNVFNVFFEFSFNLVLSEMCKKRDIISGERVIGKNIRKAILLLRDFVQNVYGCTVWLADTDGGDLGYFYFKDNEIELKKDVSLNAMMLTFAHEVGHVLTFSGHRSTKYNEVLAEFLGYLLIFSLGLNVSGYSYLQKMRDNHQYIKRKKYHLREKLLEFMEWAYNKGDSK